ncbi:deleted in malignant brain tumors 1 protein-like isoform X2 [Patiria miniata]|uniref:Uncharacterized protein n=1 Tax=Patiria miniata TaxID=46514 RepID=A0A913ZQS3_PATMI|nr:deleted in malignant brain tumors 1 protein-like isoform X2 [Patiria miniata]
MSSTTILKLCLIIALFRVHSAHPLEEEAVVARPLKSGLPCTAGPLGMASGEIKDSGITASTSAGSYGPTKARPNSGSYWLSNYCRNEWIQVDLGASAAVTGVVVKGHSSGNYYITTFTVRYSMTGESDDWQSLADTDGQTIELDVDDGSGEAVTVNFPVTLMTRFIRMQIASYQGNCYLNLEVLGCRDFDSMLRLVDGDGKRSGRVEIYHDDVWGAICDNGWDMKEASIVCHQLGFLEAEEATSVSLEESEEEVPIVMNRVSCKGSERRLVDCPFVCSSIQQCNGSHVAGVTCKPNIIRLVGGSNHTNGRVELYQGNAWGTLCDTDWDVMDAEVVCRQLGFSGAAEAKSGAHYGQGEGPVYMDGLACDGSESKIWDCPSFCWEEVACNHTQDAGVVCRQDVETVTVSDTIPLE